MSQEYKYLAIRLRNETGIHISKAMKFIQQASGDYQEALRLFRKDIRESMKRFGGILN